MGVQGNKRVFGLVIDFGTSQSPKSTRPLTTYWCPSRPGHPALRNNFASSLLLRTWLPMTGRRVRRPTLFSLWRKARRENSAASRLLESTSLRFALHGWQRMQRPPLQKSGETLTQSFNISAMRLPMSAGERTTSTPADSSAWNFASAVPLPPLMMAPACPMRLPGGAVTPAI